MASRHVSFAGFFGRVLLLAGLGFIGVGFWFTVIQFAMWVWRMIG